MGVHTGGGSRRAEERGAATGARARARPAGRAARSEGAEHLLLRLELRELLLDALNFGLDVLKRKLDAQALVLVGELNRRVIKLFLDGAQDARKILAFAHLFDERALVEGGAGVELRAAARAGRAG